MMRDGRLGGDLRREGNASGYRCFAAVGLRTGPARRSWSNKRTPGATNVAILKKAPIFSYLGSRQRAANGDAAPQKRISVP